MASLSSLLWPLLGLLMALVQPSRGDSATCSQMQSVADVEVLEVLSLEYDALTNAFSYWSTGCSDLKPSCVLLPENAEGLSAVMEVLVANNESFAVKSGGHNPNKYFASIDGGPLISTSALTEVTYDESTNTVRIGPGNKWQDVHSVLDPLGVTVVGGRIGSVGVGGYLIGGGLSFLSSQYGWASNNLVAVEMVLPNGTITEASNSTNPDLFAAIKGGGNNFGIVTAFIVQAYPIGQIWGGNLVWFGQDKTQGILDAVRNFTETYDDPKAAIIPTSELTLANSTDLWILFVFYDGPEPPAGVFDEFLALDPAINTCKTQAYGDLLQNNDNFVLHGFVYTIGTETTPLPPADRPDIMKSYWDSWHNTSASRSSVFGLIASLALQPVPKSLATVARGKGGDLLDLDDEVDRIIFELDYSYSFESLDSVTVDAAMVEAYSGLKDLVDGYVADGSLPDAYRPLFMNDAYFRQDYWGRLRPESRTLAEDVQASVDPSGIMQKLSQGFHM